MNYSIFSKLKIFSKRGFTLVELIVVIAIATVMMSVLVIQQSKWNDSLVVSSQAYEMALMIRQAQVYALGVRENPAASASGDKFSNGYGVYFDKGNLDRYILFGDVNGNKAYDSGEEIEIKNFTRGVLIYDMCGVKGTGQYDERCAFSGPGTNVSKITILYKRPEPKAEVVFLTGGNNPSTNVVPSAKIYIKSPQGISFYIEADSTGQISAKEGAP